MAKRVKIATMSGRQLEVDLDSITLAMQELGHAFSWSTADEGAEYWQQVMLRLSRYSRLAYEAGSEKSEK